MVCFILCKEVSRHVRYAVDKCGMQQTTQTEILLTTEEQGKPRSKSAKPRDKRETRHSAKDATQKALA